MNSSIDVPVCLVHQVREAHGLSQAELARRCGLTRQAIHVIESGQSIPSILTALKIAEVLGCPVEDLYPRPGTELTFDVQLPKQTRLTTNRLDVARVRDRWLGFPTDQASSFLQGFHAADALLQRSKPTPRATPLRPKSELERNIIVVGCDPGLGIVRDYLKTVSAGRMLWFSSSSQESLRQLEAGRAHVAGIHFVGQSGDENLRRASQLVLPGGGVLMRFAHWEMGWLVAPGNPKRVRGVDDLVRRDVRFLNREKGSGSRYLLEVLLDQAGISPGKISSYETLVKSHNEGGEKVAAGLADVAMGLRSVATIHELDFVPIAQVGFDLVIPNDLIEHPTVAQLCEALQSSRMRRELRSLPGYETAETGRILAQLPPSS